MAVSYKRDGRKRIAYHSLLHADSYTKLVTRGTEGSVPALHQRPSFVSTVLVMTGGEKCSGRVLSCKGVGEERR